MLILAILGGMMVSIAPACAPTQTPTPTPSDIVASDNSTPLPTYTPPAYTVQDVLQALESNQNLKSDEKDFYVNTFHKYLEPLLKRNEQYISKKLINDVGNYKIEYKGKCEQNWEHAQNIDAQTEGNRNYPPITCYYYGSNFKEVLGKDNQNSDLVTHEFFHVFGGFFANGLDEKYYPVMEGVNDLLLRQSTGGDMGLTIYNDNVIMAQILCELFGNETIEASFFKENLSPVVQKIQAKNPDLDTSSIAITFRQLIIDIQSLSEVRQSGKVIGDIQTLLPSENPKDNELLQLYLSVLTRRNLPPELKLGKGETVRIKDYNNITKSVDVDVYDEAWNLAGTVKVPLPNRDQWLAQHP